MSKAKDWHALICQLSDLWICLAGIKYLSHWFEHNALISIFCNGWVHQYQSRKLYFEGYIYTNKTDGLQFWRCQNHRLVGQQEQWTSEGRSVIVTKEHDHPPNPAQTTTQLAILTIRHYFHSNFFDPHVLCTVVREIFAYKNLNFRVKNFSNITSICPKIFKRNLNLECY